MAIVIIFVSAVNVYSQPTVYNTIPYSTGFETAVLDANWYTTSSTTDGRIQIWDSSTLTWSTFTATAHTGTYWLGMDNSVGGSYVTNEAWIGLDLTGKSAVHFSFWWAEWNDETETYDGIFISDNGGTSFTKVLDLNGASYTDLQWSHFNLSLDSLHTIYGLNYTSNYVIKLQQYDNYYFAGGNDGFLFDDIDVYQECSNSSATISETVCGPYTVPSGNAVYHYSGTYLDTIPNVSGCDSLLTINLTILNTYQTIVASECESYTSPSGNNTWYASGTYLDTIPNTAGCDSLLTINLTILNTYQTIVVSDCESYTSPSGNITWYASGTYMDTIPNTAGCDSIITVEFTLGTSYNNISESACEDYISPSGNYTWYTSGTYLDTIPNTAGCDSIITIDLVILNTYGNINPVECVSYTSPSGNYIWTISGTYQDTIPNSAGCDSIITIDLTIIPVDISVTNLSPVLTANAASATYQWLDCNNSFAPISGEISQSFTATVDGDYAVEIIQNGCTDTSACISVTGTGIFKNDFGHALLVYPNPTKGKVTIEISGLNDDLFINVSDHAGKIISSGLYSAGKAELSIEGSAGYYYLEIVSADSKKAVIRLMKE